MDEITNALMQVAAAAILGVGTWAITRFTTWLNLKNSAEIRVALESALQKSVTYGLQQSQQLIRDKGWDNLEVKNKALASAAPYMMDRFKDTLKAAGVDINNHAAMTEAVMGALDRAFPAAADRAAASPATPPATAPNPPTTAELPATPEVVIRQDVDPQ